MATINPHTTRATGTVLTAAIYNADHQNHITNANSLNVDAAAWNAFLAAPSFSQPLVGTTATFSGAISASSYGAIVGTTGTFSGAVTGASFAGAHTGTFSGTTGAFSGAVTGASFTGTHLGSGASLTALNGTNITTGTVADARIATTIARTNIAEVFSSNIDVAGVVTGSTFSSVSRVFQSDTAGSAILRPTPGSSTGQFSISTAGVGSAVNFTATSDERIKTNIRTVDNALDIIDKLRGCFFDKYGVPGMGVIAQETEQVLPMIVHEDEIWYDENREVIDDRQLKRVDYDAFAGLFIEAIKELHDLIKELKA